VFIAFAAEELGLVGSREYVKALTHDQRSAIRAMINLECLGLTVPEIWASHADPKLFQAYIRVMNALHLQPTAVNVDKVGDDDAHSFRNIGIPTATLHSITQETFPLLHTSKDKVTAVHSGDYYDAYRVAAALLAYLDT
jgi:Zn-dependent M28 family amino/carboxypeptidase